MLVTNEEMDSVCTAKDLLELEVTEIPMLVEGLIQETGLVGLTGSSDVAKSTLLRQLSLSIARGDDEFIGFPLNTRSNKVVYVSTEDVMQDLAFLVRRQLENPSEIEDCWDNLTFITDSYNLLEKLEELLEEQSPDCVIIDCFTDIFTGDMNMASRIRPLLNRFKNLSQRYGTLFIMLNHVGKGKERNRPSKHNSLGSQAFEAKMRMLAELRRDPSDSSIRHLCIVKGNYIADEEKNRSYVLNFDTERLWFENTGRRVHFDDLGARTSTLQDEWLDRCLDFKEEDPERSITAIYNLLQEEGFEGGRSTVGNWIRDNWEG